MEPVIDLPVVLERVEYDSELLRELVPEKVPIDC